MADLTVKRWLESQTLRIKEIAMDEEFAHINYSELVPVTTEGSPFATAVAFASTNAVGKAEFINGNADDVPLADVNLQGAIAPVHFGAIGYGYGYDEIGTAQAGGLDLSARKATAARLAYEEFMQDVAFIGSKEKGIKGLFNQPNANVSRGFDNSTWANVDAAAALALVNKAIALTGVQGRPTADTVILPYTLYTKLSSLIMADGRMTALEFITQFNIAATQGRAVKILADAGLESVAAGNKARIVAYRRAPDVVELSLPMPHQFLGVHQAGPLRWEVPGVFRLAGVNVVRSRDFGYLDNTAS